MKPSESPTIRPFVAQGPTFSEATMDNYLNNEAHYERHLENSELARHEAGVEAMYAAQDVHKADEKMLAAYFAEIDECIAQSARENKMMTPTWYRRFMDAIRNPSHIEQVNSIH